MKKSKLMVFVLAIVILPSATFAKNVNVNLPKFPVKINGVKMVRKASILLLFIEI